MKVDIWSDVRCPFCYIGKRRFEKALENFPHRDRVEVQWHSFELDPNLETDPGTSTVEYFTRTKGVPVEQAKQMLAHATDMAKDEGLKMKLEEAVLANSFNAHRLIQFAKKKGLGDEIEEALFEAHFTDSENIDDKEVLLQVGISIGLNKNEVADILASDAYEREVKQDQLDARKLGVQGVPFFVLNNKYGISGAQSSEIFQQTLEKAWEEYSKTNPSLIMSKGDSCSSDGECD